MPSRYQWPNDRPGSCVLSVDVDGEVPHLWQSRDSRPRLAELEQRRFGPRVGVHRLLSVLDDHGLRASFYIPGHYAHEHPSAVVAIAEAGHEIGLHGHLHEPPTALTKVEFAAALRRSREVLATVSGAAPTGFRSPSWDMTPESFEVLQDEGLDYDSSMMGYDHPYLIGSLVEVPVQWSLDDAPFYRYVGGSAPGNPPVRPRDLAEAWCDELEAAARFGTLAVITVHDWLSGRGAAAAALDRVLARAADLGLWRATVAEVADWHRHREQQGVLPSPTQVPGGTHE